MCKYVFDCYHSFRPVMYETLKSTVNLEHSPSISKIIMRQNKLTDIQERAILKERKPSPGDHNPENYENYYKKLRLGHARNIKLKETLRLYDPIFASTKGKKGSVGSSAIEPGPSYYSPLKLKPSKPSTF